MRALAQLLACASHLQPCSCRADGTCLPVPAGTSRHPGSEGWDPSPRCGCWVFWSALARPEHARTPSY